MSVTNARHSLSVQEPSHGADTPRLLLTVTFGARAAVLAGVVAAACVTAAPAVPAAAAATHAVTTVALSAPISGLARPADTSCCG